MLYRQGLIYTILLYLILYYYCDGSEPNEIGIDEYGPDEMGITDVTGLTDCHVTRKGIYIARPPSTLLVL